jgi:hypothetical protein
VSHPCLALPSCLLFTVTDRLTPHSADRYRERLEEAQNEKSGSGHELSSPSASSLRAGTGRLDVTLMNIRDMPEVRPRRRHTSLLSFLTVRPSQTKKLSNGADCYLEVTIDYPNEGDGTFYDYPARSESIGRLLPLSLPLSLSLSLTRDTVVKEL